MTLLFIIRNTTDTNFPCTRLHVEAMTEKCLILDNGSHTVKCGWRSDKSPVNLYNWIMRPKDRRRQFVGTQIDGCQDMSNIHITSPFQKVEVNILVMLKLKGLHHSESFCLEL